MVLYQADVREEPIAQALQRQEEELAQQPKRGASWVYAQEIIEGVAASREQIDEAILATSPDWSLQRMPHIDRNILRIAVWEMQHAAHPVPVAVAINEALELAKAYSTESSARFVNGVLASIAADLPQKE